MVSKNIMRYQDFYTVSSPEGEKITYSLQGLIVRDESGDGYYCECSEKAIKYQQRRAPELAAVDFRIAVILYEKGA